jgi:virulence factor BrkB
MELPRRPPHRPNPNGVRPNKDVRGRSPTPQPRGLFGRLIGVAGSAGSRFFAAACTQHAAGIAYRVLFSLAPLAIVLVSVFGLVLQDDDVREQVVDRVIEALPVDASGKEDVESAREARRFRARGGLLFEDCCDEFPGPAGLIA